MQDWLGNSLEVGDLVVYTSKSRHVGMVLGRLTLIAPNRIVMKPLAYSGPHSVGKAISLAKHTDAYKAITKYEGNIPDESLPEV